MHRPIRTRRLAIAARVSLAFFVLGALVELLSFGNRDGVSIGDSPRFGLSEGSILYYQELPLTDAAQQPRPFAHSFWYISAVRGQYPNSPTLAYLRVQLPLHFPLLLLFIVPIRWLIARPANAPAFPVINKP